MKQNVLTISEVPLKSKATLGKGIDARRNSFMQRHTGSKLWRWWAKSNAVVVDQHWWWWCSRRENKGIELCQSSSQWRLASTPIFLVSYCWVAIVVGDQDVANDKDGRQKDNDKDGSAEKDNWSNCVHSTTCFNPRRVGEKTHMQKHIWSRNKGIGLGRLMTKCTPEWPLWLLSSINARVERHASKYYMHSSWVCFAQTFK